MTTLITSPLPAHLNDGSSQVMSNTMASRTQSSPGASPQRPGPSSPRAGSPRAGVSGAIDVESVLRAHGGDVKRALEAMVTERNSLVSLLVCHEGMADGAAIPKCSTVETDREATNADCVSNFGEREIAAGQGQGQRSAARCWPVACQR